MDFSANKTTTEIIKEVHSEEHILETFFLMLMVNGTENYGNNLISWKILVRSFIAQLIMMLVLINMVLSVEHH